MRSHVAARGRAEWPQELHHRSGVVPGGQASDQYGGDSAIVWDMEVGKLVSYTGHKDDINSVAVSPADQHVFVTAGQDGRCLVWDMRTKKDVASRKSETQGKGKEKGFQTFEPTSTFTTSLEKESVAINCVIFPDGQAFLAAVRTVRRAYDYGATVWSLHRGQRGGQPRQLLSV